MFDLKIDFAKPTVLAICSTSKAIEEENISKVEDTFLLNVVFAVGLSKLHREAVSAPIFLLSLLHMLIAIPESTAEGSVYCNNEPFFFFYCKDELVTFTRYNPKDISDLAYQNNLGAASRADVIISLAKAVASIRGALNNFTNGKLIRPDDQAWGALSIISNNPFLNC